MHCCRLAYIGTISNQRSTKERITLMLVRYLAVSPGVSNHIGNTGNVEIIFYSNSSLCCFHVQKSPFSNTPTEKRLPEADYRRQVERESCSRKAFPGTRMVNTRSQPRSKGRRETLGTNGKEVSWSLRWLNTVGSL